MADNETPFLRPLPIHSTEPTIDLVDLGVTVARRWRSLVAFGTIWLLVGLTFAWVATPSYTFRSVIGLGSYPTSDGDRQPVVPLESARAALANGIVDQVVAEVAPHHGLPPDLLRLKVKGIGDTSLLLEGRGPEELEAAYLDLQRRVLDLLAQRVDAEIEGQRAALQEEIAKKRRALQRREDPRLTRIRRLDLETKVKKAENGIAALERRERLLREQLAALDTEQALLEARRARLKQRLAMAQGARVAATTAVRAPTEALTALMLLDQLRADEEALAALDEQLAVDLPRRRKELTENLASLRQEKATRRLALEQLRLRLENFDVEHEREIAGLRQRITTLETRLRGIQPTRFLAEPSRSARPAGLSRTAAAILWAGAGLILALGLVFFQLYLEQVRRRLRPLPAPAHRGGGVYEPTAHPVEGRSEPA